MTWTAGWLGAAGIAAVLGTGPATAAPATAAPATAAEDGAAEDGAEESGPATARAQLVEQIERHASQTGPITGHARIDPAILEVIGDVPRHAFVLEEVAPFAYLDLPLPAAHGLRESQPFLVALMTDLVEIDPGDEVLILGVGGGYHAAVASRLAARVSAVDLDEAAGRAVGERLTELDYRNVELRTADPYDGWPEGDRRFDAIIVRLAIDYLPPLLLEQLAPDGRLVAPVGPADAEQMLTLVTRRPDGSYAREAILPVRFMRLPGGERI